jgi:hypothetical protein
MTIAKQRVRQTCKTQAKKGGHYGKKFDDKFSGDNDGV